MRKKGEKEQEEEWKRSVGKGECGRKVERRKGEMHERENEREGEVGGSGEDLAVGALRDVAVSRVTSI